MTRARPRAYNSGHTLGSKRYCCGILRARLHASDGLAGQLRAAGRLECRRAEYLVLGTTARGCHNTQVLYELIYTRVEVSDSVVVKTVGSVRRLSSPFVHSPTHRRELAGLALGRHIHRSLDAMSTCE